MHEMTTVYARTFATYLFIGKGGEFHAEGHQGEIHKCFGVEHGVTF